MAFQLGLKITRDQHSTDFHVAKDPVAPIFVSTDTDSVFILSAHLKGFEEENIKININEDGTRLTISGDKVVSQTIMSGWRVYQKEEEVKEFRKTFKIPDGVVLDRIRAKFVPENSSLTIYMPKSKKGIRGHGVEVVKDGEHDGERRAAGLSENTAEQKGHEKEQKHGDEQVQKDDKHDVDAQHLASKQKLGPLGDENGEAAKPQNERGTPEGNEGGVVERSSGFFGPSFFKGSALIASLVMLVVGFVRISSTKKKQ